ncbi:3-hydroxyacyl-[acyl-carrier-protein] dehydratase [Kitasatospora gansuensis]|uniref:3-hydroxyacyl-[acyl-carrier-protein] dehydratase n=1 Tax=Kitasatospora gansuensis TaxID=258050 RepID=A0A7W7SF95_9ACTN|nr:3-hydroxyacyl-ACP dehydratase FabZ [Kitasatospora gansuensis]MBB4948281.1 3-hydroxyacyl-[acyl-carrier-protein] dehydratase [Kitasatospora gansuensis]
MSSALSAADGRKLTFDANQIRELLPHRWPMLFVDRAYDVIPGKSGYGIKNVTVSEPFFAGHYPDQSIMPGVLIVEAMAQLTAVVYASAWKEEVADSDEVDTAGRVGYLGAIRQMKFSRLVVPGDQLVLRAELGNAFGTLTPVTVQASVGGELVAKGSLTVTERSSGGGNGLQ